jgi:hypothetical protein
MVALWTLMVMAIFQTDFLSLMSRRTSFRCTRSSFGREITVEAHVQLIPGPDLLCGNRLSHLPVFVLTS